MLSGHKNGGKLRNPEPDSVGFVLGRVCSECDEPIPNTLSGKAKYCSARCRKIYYARIKGKKEESNLNSCTRGALSELIASTDLMKRGYEVFRALNPGASCDLIAMSGRTLYRVEVRTGFRNLNGTIEFGKQKTGDHRQDTVAVVLQDETVVYIPDIPLEAT